MNEKINDVLLGTNQNTAEVPNENQVIPQQIETDVRFLYEAYTEENVTDANFDVKPELITLLGLEEYGKSTFVGSFYHILRTREEVSGYRLIDSDTITGFERRLYLRQLNEAGKSDVKRTRRKKGSLLNVILMDCKENARHIMLSDGAGETYRDCQSDNAIVREQIAVKAANRLLIFVNCDEFNNPTKPWREDLKTLLKRFNDNEMLPNDALIYIVLNKFDRAKDIVNDKLNSYIQEVKTIVELYFTVSEDNIFRVNSKGLSMEDADNGLENLIETILKPIPENRNAYKKIDWITNAIKESK